MKRSSVALGGTRQTELEALNGAQWTEPMAHSAARRKEPAALGAAPSLSDRLWLHLAIRPPPHRRRGPPPSSLFHLRLLAEGARMREGAMARDAGGQKLHAPSEIAKCRP